MSERRTYTIAEIAAPTKSALATGPFGSAISAQYFRTSGVPVLRGGNLSLEVGRRLVEDDLVFVDEAKAAQFERSIARRGDLVFTCWGTVGQIGLIDNRSRYDRYVVSNKQMKLTPNPEIVQSLFLYYALSSPQAIAQVKGSSIGSSVPGFNLTQLRQIRISIPDLQEQQAIAELLGALDDKIAVNELLSRKCSELAFAHGFAFLDTHDGEEVSLAEVSTITKGSSYRSADLGHGDDWLVTLKCVGRDGTFQPRGMKRYGGAFKESQQVQAGDVVVAQTDLTQRAEVIGRPVRVVVPENRHGRLVASLDLVVVRPGARVSREMLAVILATPHFREHALAYCNGTTVLHMGARALPEYRFNLPDIADVKGLTALIRPLFMRSDHARRENGILGQLRDALLPKLLSGEMRIKDAEQLVSDAA